MDGKLFDRITQTLAGSAHRRATLRATAAAAFAGASAGLAQGIAGAKKKRRCRERLKKCGGRKKCCNGSGLIRCQTVQDAPKPECDGFSGRRCCGIDGASCDPGKNHCDCCPGTFCIELAGAFRCSEPVT